MRHSPVWITLLLVLSLAACSAPGLVYDRLDWAASLKLRHYVSLKAPQRERFQQGFAQAWAWHRRNELPAYAAELRGMAAALDRPVSAADVARYSDRLQDYWNRSALRLLDVSCPVLRSLDAGQVQAVLTTLDEDNQRFADKFVEPPAAQRARNSRDRMRKWLERWTGPFNPRQEQLLQRWSQQRSDLSTEWLRLRQQTRGDWAAALAQRANRPGCEAFRPLVLGDRLGDGSPFASVAARNELLLQQFIADLIAAMDPAQRAHTQHELLEFADQLQALASKPA